MTHPHGSNGASPAGAHATAGSTRLATRDLSLAYGSHTVVDEVSIEVPDGCTTAIVGPNGCGKSTLLRALARLMAPTHGEATLDGRPIHRLDTRDVARQVGLLPQSPLAPQGITVEELVARGRTPHQRMFRPWSRDDQANVEAALVDTGLEDLRDRQVSSLSGGQRQRVWIAMVLAQDTPVMLLDEPTTWLDIAHQYEVLDLLHDLKDRQGRTIVVVLHDLHQAARYADHLVAMSAGRVVATGSPATVLTADLVRDVFHLDVRVVADPVTGTPLVVPVGLPGSLRPVETPGPSVVEAPGSVVEAPGSTSRIPRPTSTIPRTSTNGTTRANPESQPQPARAPGDRRTGDLRLLGRRPLRRIIAVGGRRDAGS